MSRIGPAMQRAKQFVQAHDGCSKLAVAEAVGPHGSRMYGYRTVERAIKVGLIRVTGRRGAAYTLSVEEIA